jgi:hypothetical protein
MSAACLTPSIQSTVRSRAGGGSKQDCMCHPRHDKDADVAYGEHGGFATRIFGDVAFADPRKPASMLAASSAT